MKNIIISIIILGVYLFNLSLLGSDSIINKIPPQEYSKWEVLLDDEVWVGWTEYSEIFWGKSISKLPFSIQTIANILEDRENYKNVFDRITTSKIVGEDIVYIILDMPFPFASRDYIVKNTQKHVNNERIYQFLAIEHKSIPINSENVRLINAAGEWRLLPLNDYETIVTYIWNGELLGDFPDWALTHAWTTQGEEVLNWLKGALYEK